MSEDNSTFWDTYDYMLTRRGNSNRQQDIRSAVQSFSELASNSPFYQPEAQKNGITQPIVAVREGNECKVSIFPTDTMLIGDIFECYGSKWIVVETYTDEYGLTTGKMWLCNKVIKFQNNNSIIIEKPCVIDDGSYSKNSGKALITPDAQYSMYISLDYESEKIYIDKRFCIDTMYNKNQELIMQVMKVVWIDKINQNYGDDSHLLKLKLDADVYSEEKDNISLLVCDYITPVATGDNDDVDDGEQPTISIMIDGKNSIRTGTTRTYECVVTDSSGNIINTESPIIWSINNNLCTILTNNNTCNLSIPLNDNLIGAEITITASCNDGLYSASKIVKVVSIG